MEDQQVKAELRLRIAREQANQWIATHLMDWKIEQIPADDDEGYHEVYVKDGKQLGFTESYPFHPAESITDAFWAIDTITATRNIRIVLDVNARHETEVSIRNSMGTEYGIFGTAVLAPNAVAKALLYLIADDEEEDMTLTTALHELIQELGDAEDEWLTFQNTDFTGRIVDLDSYYPEIS